MVALFAPPLARVALQFGPAEYFSLMVLGLVSSVALAHGSLLKALGHDRAGPAARPGRHRHLHRHAALHLRLARTRRRHRTSSRVAVGVFGLGEILRNLETERHARSVLVTKISGLLPTREDSAHDRRRSCAAPPWARCSASCRAAAPSSPRSPPTRWRSGSPRRPSEFGKGAIEGVAGPESANNAGAQTSFIPMLTLGIPSNPVMALMIGAMIIQGITPGPKWSPSSRRCSGA